MSAYDFRALSPIDFEHLTRDLLQCELGIRLESFRAGPDKGIDLRYSKNYENDLIIQCKKYAPKNYSHLKRDLKNHELSKINRLQAKRYILVTSVELSPDNKQELRNLLHPHVKSNEDIFGLEDINNLLGRYPGVEKKHFKLWLTSTAVLEHILNSGIFNYSHHNLEDAQFYLAKYVVNESLELAQKLLDEHRYCIISGAPGVGKTTLARVLIAQLIEKDFQLISISQDISEAWKFAGENSDSKVVFYYDDFLGSTFLDTKLTKNEDKRLINFIKAISKSKNKYLIFTTREYILQQAAQCYEAFGDHIQSFSKCLVKVESYTKRDRAKILYNHIYFSSIDHKYKVEILRDGNYRKLIDHRNFNPRLIEGALDSNIISQVSPNDYFDYFLKLLNNPQSLWRHIFEKQLTSAAKSLLHILLTMPTPVLASHVRRAFDSYYPAACKDFNWTYENDTFDYAVKELQGSFVNTFRHSARSKDLKNVLFIDYMNPSVEDFLRSQINRSINILRLLLHHSYFIDQYIRIVLIFDIDEYLNCLKKELARDSNLSSVILETTGNTVFVIENHNQKGTNNLGYIRSRTTFSSAVRFILDLYADLGLRVLPENVVDFFSVNFEKILVSGNVVDLIEILDAITESSLRDHPNSELWISQIEIQCLDWSYSLSDFYSKVLYLYQIVPERLTRKRKEKIIRLIHERVPQDFSQNPEFYSHFEDIDEELLQIESLGNDLDFDPQYLVERLHAKKEEFQEERDDNEDFHYEWKSISASKSPEVSKVRDLIMDSSDESEIDEMFSSLMSIGSEKHR